MQPRDRLVHISSRRGVDGEEIQPSGNQGAIDRVANVLLDFLVSVDNGLSFLKGVEQGIFTCIRLSVPVMSPTRMPKIVCPVTGSTVAAE